jgi:two-component system cell cycle sensor histidine kinase/response regulator CckA
MPGPNGRDLAERAVAWKPGLKVIYMSGYTDDVLISAGMRGPDVLFQRKPFQLDSLPALIREVLDTHTP